MSLSEVNVDANIFIFRVFIIQHGVYVWSRFKSFISFEYMDYCAKQQAY
jgi:hypothetical protein